MDQLRGEGVVSDAAGKVGDSAIDLASNTRNIIQDKIEQTKPALQDLQETATATMNKAAELAQKASTVGGQAVDAVQGAARDIGNQASQAATAVYQQGARASESLSQYTAEQPLTALLVAAAIGYGLAYLIHRA